MAKYAATTAVPVERSKGEIEATLMRYGATEFVSGWDQHCARIGFRINGRFVRFELPLPDRNDDEFVYYYRGCNRHRRTDVAAMKQWEQACRQRWRALALCIKAKLEAVEAGITTFEDEFMAHIVLPNGNTVGQFMRPQLEAAYENGAMPVRLLEAMEDGAA